MKLYFIYLFLVIGCQSAFSECLCGLNEEILNRFLKKEKKGILIDVPAENKDCTLPKTKITRKNIAASLKKAQNEKESYHLLKLAYSARIAGDPDTANLFLTMASQSLGEDKGMNAKKAYCVLVLLRSGGFFEFRDQEFHLVEKVGESYQEFLVALQEKGYDDLRYDRLKKIDQKIIKHVNSFGKGIFPAK